MASTTRKQIVIMPRIIQIFAFSGFAEFFTPSMPVSKLVTVHMSIKIIEKNSTGEPVSMFNQFNLETLPNTEKNINAEILPPIMRRIPDTFKNPLL